MDTETPVLKDLITSLIAAQSEIPDIEKNCTAKIKTKSGYEYSYKYADLADIKRIVTPILSKHDLAITNRYGTAAEQDSVITTLMHKSGQVLTSEFTFPKGLPPQEKGANTTYGRRYNFCLLVDIAPDEDIDGQPKADTAEAGISRPDKPQTPRETPQETAKRLAANIKKENDAKVAHLTKETPNPFEQKPIKYPTAPAVTKENVEEVGNTVMTGKTLAGIKIKDAWQVTRAKALAYAMEVRRVRSEREIDPTHQMFLGYGELLGFFPKEGASK